MADDTNWEAQLDWSKIDPVGGIGFYSFIKGSVLKSMDEGLGQLVGIKEEKERKLGSWDEIAKVAQRLNDDFHRVVDAEIFKNTIRRIDERGCMIFPDGTKMTIQRWLEFGQVFTETLCQGCRIPDELKKDVAKTAGDIAKAETLRDFLKGYIEVAEMDFRLRNAPARFKTKLFRDTLRLVNGLVAIGEKVKVEVLPEFLVPLAVEVAKIKEMAARTQKTMRLAKKTIERVGDRFWMDANPLPKMV